MQLSIRIEPNYNGHMWSISKFGNGEVLAAGWACKDYDSARRIAKAMKTFLINEAQGLLLEKEKDGSNNR